MNGDKLTPNFYLREFTRSSEAAKLGIDNSVINGRIVDNIMFMCQNILEPIRHALGDLPLTITSGYRKAELNKAVGGAKNSRHMFGLAVDFVPSARSGLSIEQAFHHIRTEMVGLRFDTMIQEFDTWIHIDYDPKERLRCYRNIMVRGKSQLTGVNDVT